MKNRLLKCALAAVIASSLIASPVLAQTSGSDGQHKAHHHKHKHHHKKHKQQ